MPQQGYIFGGSVVRSPCLEKLPILWSQIPRRAMEQDTFLAPPKPCELPSELFRGGYIGEYSSAY